MKPFAVRMGHAGVAVTRAIAACLVVLMSAHALAQVSEYELKAAFLFNFALFTQPIGAASNATTAESESARPYHICIFGKDPFGAAAKALSTRMIGGRPIVVKIAGAVDELKQCELVFIGEIDRDSARRAAHSLSGRPIITVGESNDFVAAGAVFNLLMSDDKVTFQVNTQVARIQQLEVSAKLTRLAKSIH